MAGKVVLVVVLVLVLAGVGWWFLGRGPGASTETPVWTVARGPLRVTVLEGGSLQSLRPEVISSEVEGEAKIISIVPEGTVITPEDVAAGKILVELDSSDLRERLSRQQIDTALAEAASVQAASNLDIQTKQGESDTRKAELEVRFAELELHKYLGGPVSTRLAEAAERRPDVKALLEDEALGGEALQEKRKKESEIHLAKEEVSRARTKLEGTEKLLAKGYASAEERAADDLALRRHEAERDQAEIALSIFLAYEAPKEIEKRLSDLLEARENLDRVRAKSASSLAQARADLKGQEEKLRLETARLRRLQAQLASCVIRAKSPGIVVYASADDWRGSDDPIKEGTTVRERQAIISLPDTSNMGVRVNVHESALDKVKVGQSAAIKVDAFPDLPLRGKVVKVATIPNQANRWMNPDTKVYTTEVSLEGAPSTLRPGMSAKVEILVLEVASTLSVPVQAVAGRPGAPTVHVEGPKGVFTERPVATGPSNDRFVAIEDGLREGERVLLSPPRPEFAPSEESEEKPDREPSAKPKDGAPAAPSRTPRGGRRPRPSGGDAETPSAPAPTAPTPGAAGEATPAPAGSGRG
jgi:RND family efflux transporter MFP subunit